MYIVFMIVLTGYWYSSFLNSPYIFLKCQARVYSYRPYVIDSRYYTEVLIKQDLTHYKLERRSLLVVTLVVLLNDVQLMTGQTKLNAKRVPVNKAP